MRHLATVVGVAVALAAAPSARADNRDIVIKSQGERSGKTVAVLAGLAGAGVLLGGIGVYFNLDSRDAADSVSQHRFVHAPWDATRQAAYDRAASSGTDAKIAYGIGGALLVGAIIGYIVTEPATETTVIHPRGWVTPTASLTPGGGAMVGGTWSF
jgi:hypothetical protein